jgi:hypothetical protein
MFLDRENGLNEYVGKVVEGGAHLFVYGHAKEQYNDRFAAVKNILKHDLLEWDNLRQRCLDLVVPRYNRCMNDRNAVDKEERKRMRNIIRDEVYLQCGDKLFIVDLGILVKGTEVEFYDRYNKNVLPQYKDLYNNKVLKLGDKVIAIETINATIRLEGEANLNFGYHHTLCNLGMNLPKNNPIKVKKQDILDLTEFMLEDDEKFGHIVTDKVKDVVAKYKKQLDKKKKAVLQ